MEPSENKPPYPECILPQPSYRPLIIEDELYSGDNRLVIQRRCNNNVCGDKITPETFGSNLAEMSVNLLGGLFEPEFVKFNPIGVHTLCSGKPFEGDYKYSEEAIGISIAIFEIHNQKFPSPRKFPNKQEYDKVKAAIIPAKEKLLNAFNKVKGNKTNDDFSKDKEFKVNYRIRVMHRPTNANYWHCQIEIAPDLDGGKTLNRDNSEWQKNALRALTSFLIPYSSFDYPNPIPKVKPTWYIRP